MRLNFRATQREALKATSGGGVFFNVFDHVTHTLKLFRFFIRHFDGEFFFKGHYEFNGIQGIGSEVFDEPGTKDDLLSIHAELVDDDVTDFFFDCFF